MAIDAIEFTDGSSLVFSANEQENDGPYPRARYFPPKDS